MASTSPTTFVVSPDVREAVLAQENNFARVAFGPEIRAAELYTEFTIGGKQHQLTLKGARSCANKQLSLNSARGTLVYNLQCDLTYFHTPDSDFGPVTIVDDPRRTIEGQILLRRNSSKDYELPALSYFNQYLIFNLGRYFFYYPSPWQVVASITAWPPEYHQYHHLQDDTPVYDFNTREPNVARKGISTISILGPLSPEEESKIRTEHAKQIEIIKQQPGYKVAPEDFLNTPPTKQ